MNGKPVHLSIAAVATTLALSACHYVKQDELDAQLAELRRSDASLRSDVDALNARLDGLEAELQGKFAEYDARIERLQGRIRIDMTAHFGYDDATLREQDKPALDDFAAVLREHGGGALVTVEGFTDPAGSPAYNRQLGQRRADAVRRYLVDNGGLGSGSVRAVSYGEDGNRQVQPGAWGDAGQANRRVALVVDYVGARG